MAKKRTEQAETKQKKIRRSAEDILEEKGKRGGFKYTLKDCMKFGSIANILFIVFVVVCLIYYYTSKKSWLVVGIFEFTAYAIETTAFILFALSIIWMSTLVRARKGMKICMISYITVEVLLMLLEFDLIPLIPYNGLSLPLIIVHSLFSSAAAFSLLLLDSQNKKVQWIVGITVTITLAGMLTGIAGYRVYASIVVNAFAYIFFFSAMGHMLRLEEVNVDCYGDPTKVTSFSSTMFADTPTMIEHEEKRKTLSEKAKRLAQDIASEEKIVLTDKDEKFEYEFGVEEEDEDDYEDDADGEDDEET